jgi:predicted lipoprotein with Yx(FWY)xxD motif
MQETKQRRGRGEDVAGRRLTSRMVAVLMLAAALGVTGLLAAGSIAGSSARQSSATVSLRKTSLGSILVSSKGHTLYLFAKDRNGRSACSGTCASYWPPLVSRSKPTAGPGLKASLLGTIKRRSGSLQVTYNRHPLYTFSLDKRAGQTNGEGNLAFGARWYAVSAKGRAILKAPAPTTTTSTTYPYP